MFLTLTVSAEVWGAEYTITFKSASSDSSSDLGTTPKVSDVVSSGTSYVASFSGCSKMYVGKSGIKLGSGSATGTMNFTLATNYQSNIKSIKVVSAKYGSDTGTLTLYSGNSSLKSGISPGTDYTHTFSSPTKVTSLKLVTSSKRAYITKIVITTEEASCTVNPTVGTTLQSVTATENSIIATIPISSVGGCNITENGLVYSTTNSTPTVEGSACSKVTTTACGSTAANKTVTITGLNCGTSYYIRGYATNEAGISYTNVTTKSTSDCPKYTVTLVPGSGSVTDRELEEKSAGAGVTLPEPTLLSACQSEGWSFAGWATASVDTETETEPTLIAAGAYSPTSNITLYAVYKRTENTQGGGSSEEIVDFSGQGYSNQQTISSYTGTDFSVAFNKGTNSNVPKYYTTGTAIRIYGGGYFTISSESTITKIVITFGSGDESNAITASQATYSNGTWTGSANSVKFTIGGSTGHRRIKSLVVTTSGGGSSSTTYYHSNPVCADLTPTLSAEPSSLSFGEVVVGQQEDLTFTLTGQNIKNATTLSISGESHGFSVSPFGIDDTGNFEKEITVTYEPTAAGNHSQTIIISSTGADDVTVSLSGTGVAQTANYTVKHYQQNITDDNYTLKETETLSGEVATTVTPAVKTYTGFGTPSSKSVEITADGKAIVEYHYARNSYTLTWNLDGGTITTAGTTAGQVKYGAPLKAPTVEKTNFQFKSWTPAVPETMPADAATYTAQWTPIYTITWLANGQEFHTQTAVEGTALDWPDSEPDAATYACNDKVFVGWTENQISGSTNTKPADLFTSKSGTLTANKTYYAVFATEEGGGGSAGETTTVALGDQVVIIQIDDEKTELTGFRSDREITNDNNYGTYAAYSTTPSATLVWTVEEGASDGTFAFKNGNYYLNLGGDNNYLSCSTTKNASSSWTVTASSNRAVVTNVQYDSRKIMWNQSSPRFASYAKNHGLNSNQYYYHIKFYKLNGGTSYSDYATTCVALPDPVISFVTTPADPIVFDPVNCGSTTTKAQAKTVQVSGANLQEYVSVEVTGPYKIARTSSTNLSDYTTSLTLDKTNTGNINANYSTIYIISCPPAQSTDATTGTLTFTTKNGNTLTVNLSTPTVNCTTYALTFNDRGNKTVENYYAGVEVPEPEDPTGVCTDPINYVFDGWAEATVANGSTEYTKVTFPYSMPGQNKTLYAVYRYTGDGGEPSNDFIKVTSAKDDWTGDYIIVDEEVNKAIGNAYKNTNTLKALDVTITDNKVVSPANEVIWQIRKNGEYYTMYNTAAEKYAYVEKADAKGAGLSTTAQNMQIIFNDGIAKVSGVNIYRCFYYYGTNTEWRTYATGSYNTGALYCRSLESYLYTSAPVCGPYVEIISGKDIYVTGGNAGGTHDLVVAQQKVAYQATRLEKDKSTGNLPSIKVLPSNITFDANKTKAVTITFDEDSVRTLQSDGTYTISGTMTISYQPKAHNVTDDIQVVLNANYNPSADVSNASFTVHARSLPEEFVIVAKSGDKWYALNGDMSNGSSANPANGQITLNDDANPTQATYAPCNTIYTFDGLPNTGDRTRVRFQGTDGAWLWAASGTNVGIQNKTLAQTPTGDNEPYNWKLETKDNTTYKFHNDNSSRLLGLSGEKFGMYASGVQEFRILPYVEKCLYNYAPTNLKVSVLKGTYVTLTWDAVAGATKYQYSTDGTTWIDAGTEPTVTINGLEDNTKYIYYIRAYHEDAGVSQECIDYAVITFTTADCDDVPTDITYTADLNSITVSWTAAAPTATIKLYLDENGEHAFFTQNGTTSPWRISTLSKNTTYYLQIFSDGTCASPIVPVKTEDVEVDIVEWYPQGIIVDINTDETVGVTLENEVSFGSGLGTEATELFFSKYYEASYNVKLVAIYNGTKNIIDLTDYIIKYGKTSWESNYITLKDFGTTKGQIQPGEEIILYSYTENNADDKKILDCVHEKFPDGDWVRVTSSNNTGKGSLSFAGDKTLALFKGKNIIDIIGAVNGSIPDNSKANAKPTWGDAKGWVCETGLSIADDSQIGISTNRCLLIRNNTVTSGENAVAQNIGDFVTLCSEWKGAQVPDDPIDNGVAASCENFAYVGTFDYSDYYTKYVPMGEGTTFDENARNDDGTVTIPITDLYKHSCRNIRIKLSNSNGDVLTDREYKVPIMITTTQGTDGQAFLDLQQNLATKEVDGEGNVIETHPLSLAAVREICKTCDVVVRDNATLMKMADDAANDHPQVRNVYVYENSSLIVPNGTNYTINNLSLRRKQDAVASLNVHPDALKLPVSAAAPISLDFRLSAESWHWFTLPYNCNISEVTWIDGTPAKYNEDWFLMSYDGETRAATQTGGNWKAYSGTTINAGDGFIIAINGNINNPVHTYELRFPMAKEVLAAEGTDKTVDVHAWGVETNIRPNHKGWNLVGNPYLAYYQRNNITNFEGLRLGQLTGPDPQTGYWTQTGDVPYVVVPIGAGYEAYEQLLASETDLLPFTAYFVQVGNDGKHASSDKLSISFDHSKLQLSATPMPASIVHRAPSEVNETEEPVIVGVALTNSLGESDKTSLVIADRFTNEYEMQADFFKWFGDYYKYYTKPVLYTIGADQGKRAFNALNEQLATQPIPMGMFAAKAGDYTFALNRRSDLSKVEEVWLHDANTNTYTNLMQNDYNFYTTKTDGGGRFTISVKLAPKVATGMENVNADKVWATTQNQQIIVNGLENNTQLWMYDAAGKLLYTEVTSNYQHRYSVPQVGTYFIALQKGTTKQTIKVVVE